MKFTILALILFLIIPMTSAACPNKHHETFMEMSESKRMLTLGVYLTISGKDCTGTKTFHMGSDTDGTSYWSVGCKEGTAYMIQIANDSEGTSTILDCAILKMGGGPPCFEKVTGF